MKSAGALKSWRVLVCGTAMLSHVLRPRFNHKVLDVPAGLGDIREQALVWRPANNFLKAVESESQFFRAKAADKPSKIVKLFAGRDTRKIESNQTCRMSHENAVVRNAVDSW